MEATQRGREERQAQGQFLGTPLLGYAKDAEMRLVPDEDQAAIVRTIFNLYDHERLGLREVQKRLIGRIPAPKGGTVRHPSYLHRLLTEPAYWSAEHLSGLPSSPLLQRAQPQPAQSALSHKHPHTGGELYPHRDARHGQNLDHRGRRARPANGGAPERRLHRECVRLGYRQRVHQPLVLARELLHLGRRHQGLGAC